METKHRVFVTFIFAVLLIAGLYGTTKWVSKTTGFAVGEDEKIRLAQCLEGKGVVMYGSIYCSYCDEQKKTFGDSFRFINYVECSENESACSNLVGVPAWSFNDSVSYGAKSIEDLSILYDCPLTG